MSEIKDFKDLKIWEKGMSIAEKCYSLTQKFPKEETGKFRYKSRKKTQLRLYRHTNTRKDRC